MTEKSNVNEGQCESRRDEIFERIAGIEKELNQMKGAINFAKYITPTIVILITVLGGYYFNGKIRDTIRHEMQQPKTESTGFFHIEKTPESTGEIEIDFREVEAFE